MAMSKKDPQKWRNAVHDMSILMQERIAANDEHSGEMIKSFMEAFCFDRRHGVPINPVILDVFADCFEVYVTQNVTLDEAFKQRKERGRPKDFDDLERNFAIGLVVLQLNRGWLKQSDVDSIPVDYDKTVAVNFDKQSLESAYAQAGRLFSLSDENIKRIYKDVIASTSGLVECACENELAEKLVSIF